MNTLYPGELEELAAYPSRHNATFKLRSARYVQDRKDPGKRVRSKQHDSRYESNTDEPGIHSWIKSRGPRYMQDPNSGKWVLNKAKDSRYMISPWNPGEYIRKDGKAAQTFLDIRDVRDGLVIDPDVSASITDKGLLFGNHLIPNEDLAKDGLVITGKYLLRSSGK